ncbi:MAG: B12-binding domain-containing protein, partial [Deltaproteobacteria bacterium]|nr:B12-binding domain-containing protein [Deltaproteobacteria bacterium]
MTEKLYKAITDLSKDEALRITEELLQSNVEPSSILEAGRAALEFVGERFATGKFFLPELIVSGDILAGVASKLKPFLEEEGGDKGKKIGKIVFGTVEGDIHDIAKDIVVFMLEVSGFEVIDL